jgi:hypothetical protein
MRSEDFLDPPIPMEQVTALWHKPLPAWTPTLSMPERSRGEVAQGALPLSL